MAIYAEPRMTRDIDLVIECQPEDDATIAALFEADCYVDVEAIREAAKRRSMFHVIHNEWIIKADFIMRGDAEYRRVEFNRRRRLDVEGAPISVVSPEDLILSKLIWAKDSSSQLQLNDVELIIKSGTALDMDYLHQWAAKLQVEVLLDERRTPWAREPQG